MATPFKKTIVSKWLEGKKLLGCRLLREEPVAAMPIEPAVVEMPITPPVVAVVEPAS